MDKRGSKTFLTVSVSECWDYPKKETTYIKLTNSTKGQGLEIWYR